MPAKPRVAIVATTPWQAQGLAAALADEARWDLVARATAGTGDAEAYVLLPEDEAEATGWLHRLPAQAPLLWIGAAPSEDPPNDPSDKPSDALQSAAASAATDTPKPARAPGDKPTRAIGRLPREAGVEPLRAALAAVLAGLSVRGAGEPWPLPRGDVPSGSEAAQPAARAAADMPVEPLTSRELEVFELLAKGLSNRDVAGVLGISSHTAKFHVAQILAKVGAATRAEAVAIGLRLGLIGL